MAKQKQTVKLKEPVRIRFKQLSNGNQSIYLDYYTGDVVSQCRIGLAYGRDKDDALVVDCFRDMFRLIERNGL